MTELVEEECPICKDWEEPCKACRVKIHESWHEIGWWWIRTEECHVGCPGRSDLGEEEEPDSETV